MNGSQLFQLVGFSLLLAVGQTLFKVAATNVQSASHGSVDLCRLAVLPVFWAAMILYAGGTLLWIHILQSVPLSRAYPFAALGFVVVPILAVIFFSERVNLAYALGALLIVAGVVITARA